MKTAVIAQARMTSSRLPGKILMKVAGRPLLQHHIDRLRDAGLDVILATTDRETDNPVEDWAKHNNVQTFRGSEHDVLGRYWRAATTFGVQTIVRTTCDCPLIDGYLITEALQRFAAANNPNLYLSNCLQRTYPRGLDFEVFSFTSLQEAYEQCADMVFREHVTPYIHRNLSGHAILEHIVSATDASEYRITVDTPEDFEVIRLLIEEHQADTLRANEIIELLVAHPEITRLNAEIEQRKI